MTGGIVEQKDNKEYRSTVQEYFEKTTLTYSTLATHQQFKHRVSTILFLSFYENFSNLFFLTSISKHMDDYPELIQEIKEWLDYTKKIDENRIKTGRELFMKWSAALEKKGIHTLT